MCVEPRIIHCRVGAMYHPICISVVGLYAVTSSLTIFISALYLFYIVLKVMYALFDLCSIGNIHTFWFIVIYCIFVVD
jgi:hypothetical protein